MIQATSDVLPATETAGARATSGGIAVLAETFHWRLPSRPELVEKVVMALKDRAEICGVCGQERLTGLVISLTEAITNAMVHGNLEISSDIRERTDGEYGRMLATRCSDPAFANREVQIGVHWDGTTCSWTISDVGHGFDVERILHRLETEGASEELCSGRGILLMRAFMDEVRWSAGGREVRLTMARDGYTDVSGDKRSQIRHAVRAKGFAGDQGHVDAIATGISKNGIDLLANGVTEAKRLMIEIDVNGVRTLVPAEVRQVTQLTADWVQIDCRFGPEAVCAMGADGDEQREAIERVLRGTGRAADGGHERRETERFQYTDVVRVERQDGTVFHGVARDLSRGGMAFIGNFGLERGELLTLTLEPETAMPAKIKCEVMRCQQLAGIYRDFGVRFLTAAGHG